MDATKSADEYVNYTPIEWLQSPKYLGLNLYSDRTRNGNGKDPYEQQKRTNILWSQLCILPNNKQAVDYIILCGSSILGKYSRAKHFDDYFNKISHALGNLSKIADSKDQIALVKGIESDFAEKKDFHHTDTELVFLKLRLISDPNFQPSVVPLLLNGESKTALPNFIKDTDVYIEEARDNKQVYKNHGLHLAFFKLLEHLFSGEGKQEQRQIIESCRKQYEEGIKAFHENLLTKEMIDILLAIHDSKQKQNADIIAKQTYDLVRQGIKFNSASSAAVPQDFTQSHVALGDSKENEYKKNTQISNQPESNFIKKLKANYQDKAYTGIAGLFDDETDVINIDKYYVNLALIREEEQKDKERQKTLTKEQIAENLDSAEQFYAVKEKIELQDIFEINSKQLYSNSQRILMIGLAGVGKSTLCQYIANQWSQDKLWNKYYQAVFRIPLRNLIGSYYPPGQKYTLLDIIQRECFNDMLNESEQEELNQFLQTNIKKYLLILDGYDELSTQVEDRYLINLVNQWLKYPNVIITSRPQMVSGFIPDSKLEILGFREKNILDYLNKFFEEKQKDKEALLQKIREQPMLYGLVHIPLNLTLLCKAWQREPWITETTLTQLYQKLLLWLQKRYLQKYHEDFNKVEQQQAFNELRSEDVEILCIDWLKNLENIAWQMNKNNKIYIEETNLFKEEKDYKLRSYKLQCLRQSGLLRLTTDKKYYYFIHLTFQEFFVAKYIASLGVLKIQDIITQTAYDKNYLRALSFTAGLLSDSEKLISYFKYFEKIQFDYIDYIDRQVFVLLIHVLAETLESKKLYSNQIQTYEELVKKGLCDLLIYNNVYWISNNKKRLLLNQVLLLPKLVDAIGFVAYCRGIKILGLISSEVKLRIINLLSIFENSLDKQLDMVCRNGNLTCHYKSCHFRVAMQSHRLWPAA